MEKTTTSLGQTLISMATVLATCVAIMMMQTTLMEPIRDDVKNLTKKVNTLAISVNTLTATVNTLIDTVNDLAVKVDANGGRISSLEDAMEKAE